MMPAKLNFTEFLCGAPLGTLWQFATRAQITFDGFAISNRFLLHHFACGARKLHAMQILFFNTAGRTIIKI